MSDSSLEVLTSETVVPAAPGYRVHYIMGEEPYLDGAGEAVIAWVVRAYRHEKTGRVWTTTTPVLVGELADNDLVIELPDGTVVYDDVKTYSSLLEALARITSERKA